MDIVCVKLKVTTSTTTLRRKNHILDQVGPRVGCGITVYYQNTSNRYLILLLNSSPMSFFPFSFREKRRIILFFPLFFFCFLHPFYSFFPFFFFSRTLRTYVLLNPALCESHRPIATLIVILMSTLRQEGFPYAPPPAPHKLTAPLLKYKN